MPKYVEITARLAIVLTLCLMQEGMSLPQIPDANFNLSLQDKNVTDGLYVGLNESDFVVAQKGILQAGFQHEGNHHTLGKYDSQIGLFFKYDGGFLDLKPPSVITDGSLDSEMLGPLSSDYILDSSPALLLVILKCKKFGTHLVHVEFQIDIEKKLNFSIYFEKTCDKGVRDGFQIGLDETSNEIIQDGIVSEAYTKQTTDILSTVEDLTDTFFLYVTQGSQVIQAPVIKSSTPSVCTPYTRDELSHGGVITEAPQPLVVTYKCHGPGVVTITVHFRMELFNAVDFSYRKHCGGGPKSGFHVITDSVMEDQRYVVRDGITQKFWKMKDKLVRKELVEVTTTFYLKVDTGMEKDYGIPVVTAHPSTVSKPTLGGEVSEGGIANESEQALIVQYHCIKSGLVNLTVTIPISQYDPIEFSWTKECGVIRPHIQRGYVTANHIMYLSMTAMFFAIGLVFRKSITRLVQRLKK